MEQHGDPAKSRLNVDLDVGFMCFAVGLGLAKSLFCGSGRVFSVWNVCYSYIATFASHAGCVLTVRMQGN
jgi:hypothetical protein